MDKSIRLTAPQLRKRRYAAMVLELPNQCSIAVSKSKLIGASCELFNDSGYAAADFDRLLLPFRFTEYENAAGTVSLRAECEYFQGRKG